MAQFSERGRERERNRCLYIFPNNRIQALEDLIIKRKKKRKRKRKERRKKKNYNLWNLVYAWKGCVLIPPKMLADSGNPSTLLISGFSADQIGVHGQHLGQKWFMG